MVLLLRFDVTVFYVAVYCCGLLLRFVIAIFGLTYILFLFFYFIFVSVVYFLFLFVVGYSCWT